MKFKSKDVRIEFSQEEKDAIECFSKIMKAFCDYCNDDDEDVNCDKTCPFYGICAGDGYSTYLTDCYLQKILEEKINGEKK